MAYTRTTWQNYPGNTPINATRLNNVEQGLVDAHNFSVICTSTTRPASPFAGQVIYETDTRRSWTYITAAWVPDDGIFTNEADRGAAIPSPFEGQRAYLTAPTVPAATGGITLVPTGVQTIYNGSVWVCVTDVGALTLNVGNTTLGGMTPTLNGSPGTNPSVTLVTGLTVLVNIGGLIYNSGSNISVIGIAVSGASTVAASTVSGYTFQQATSSGIEGSRQVILTLPTAGTNTFTLNYRVSNGTGYFEGRSISARGIA